MRVFVIASILIASAVPAAAQSVPNLTCRTTKAKVTLSGTVYPERTGSWEIACKDGATLTAVPSFVDSPCTVLSTADWFGDDLKFEVTDVRYRWTNSKESAGALNDGSPTSSKNTSVLTIDRVTGSYTWQFNRSYYGGGYSNFVSAEAEGTCEKNAAAKPKL